MITKTFTNSTSFTNFVNLIRKNSNSLNIHWCKRSLFHAEYLAVNIECRQETQASHKLLNCSHFLPQKNRNRAFNSIYNYSIGHFSPYSSVLSFLFDSFNKCSDRVHVTSLLHKVYLDVLTLQEDVTCLIVSCTKTASRRYTTRGCWGAALWAFPPGWSFLTGPSYGGTLRGKNHRHDWKHYLSSLLRTETSGRSRNEHSLRPTPQLQAKFSPLSCSFRAKLVKCYVGVPLRGWYNLRKVLDPPLETPLFVVFFFLFVNVTFNDVHVCLEITLVISSDLIRYCGWLRSRT